MIVAVTGATGNLGSALVPRLLEAGHTVRGLTRRPPRQDDSGVEWHRVDLAAADREERLRAVFEGADVVVHTVWGFQPTRDTAYLQRVDVGGSAAVLRAATGAGVRHLVHVSSLGAYSPGRDAGPVEEDWPTGGTADLPYSLHKAAVERLLDAHEAEPGHRPLVTRLRPSVYARRDVGGALARYVLPSLVPTSLLRLVPVLPLDRGFRIQLTHSDDIAAAVVLVVEQQATGAFNLAADPVLSAGDVAGVLGVPWVHLPWPALRGAAALAWTLRLQPVDPGWLDMGWSAPVMSTRRAREELGWRPAHDAWDVLADVWSGMLDGVGGASPALRPRRWAEQLVNLVTAGPVSRRPRA